MTDSAAIRLATRLPRVATGAKGDVSDRPAAGTKEQRRRLRARVARRFTARLGVRRAARSEVDVVWQVGHESGFDRGAMIRMLDHTADIGFELRSPTLEGLFEEAGRALLLAIFERPPESGGEERSVRLSAPDLETLLVRWINELVFLIQDDGCVPVHADASIADSGGGGCSLEASLLLAPLDLEGQGWQGEIKSATFHGLAVTRSGDGWRAEVILDV